MKPFHVVYSWVRPGYFRVLCTCSVCGSILYLGFNYYHRYISRINIILISFWYVAIYHVEMYLSVLRITCVLREPVVCIL